MKAEGNDRRYPAPALRAFTERLFEAEGMQADKAAAVADILVEADMLGHLTHGLALVPRYIEQIEAGVMAKAGEIEVIGDRGACVTWNGRNLPGIWLTIEGDRARHGSRAPARHHQRGDRALPPYRRPRRLSASRHRARLHALRRKLRPRRVSRRPVRRPARRPLPGADRGRGPDAGRPHHDRHQRLHHHDEHGLAARPGGRAVPWSVAHGCRGQPERRSGSPRAGRQSAARRRRRSRAEGLWLGPDRRSR